MKNAGKDEWSFTTFADRLREGMTECGISFRMRAILTVKAPGFQN